MATSDGTGSTSYQDCTVEELTDILDGPTNIPNFPDDAFDEVYPGIYIGDEEFAKDLVQLKREGITHVLNAAHGDTMFHSQVDHSIYRKIKATFLGVPAIDQMNYDLKPHFQSSAEFIDEALLGGGKVLVHCIQGVSRSATLVIAYLMIKKHMNVKDAVRLVRGQRNIYPNDGFLQQLCDLNKVLFKHK